MVDEMRKRKKKLKTLVDIVIPVYGRFDLLEACLSSIPGAMGSVPYTLTLVDNDSPDRKNFYSEFDNFDLIQNKDNKGFIGACNQGAYATRSPLIFFLNSDVILEPGSVSELVRSLDEPKVGIAGMKLLFPDTTQIQESGLNPKIRPAQKVQHVGLMTNVRGEIIHSFIGWSADSKKVNTVSEVMAVTGAALLIRREIFRRIGGFDKDFGQGTYEDVAICMAVRKMGYNVVVNPKAVGTHFVGASSEKYQKEFPLNQNYQLFINKWRDEMKQWDYNIL